MALSKIWVLAEAVEGEVAPTTLEMLAKGRELGDTVECIFGGDGAAVAETVGAHGATKVLATGDLDGRLQGPALAAAVADKVEGGDAPDLIIFAPPYDGGDTAARLSVRLDRPVITNNTDLEVDGDAVIVCEPIFGGNTIVKTKFTCPAPHL